MYCSPFDEFGDEFAVKVASYPNAFMSETLIASVLFLKKVLDYEYSGLSDEKITSFKVAITNMESVLKMRNLSESHNLSKRLGPQWDRTNG